MIKLMKHVTWIKKKQLEVKMVTGYLITTGGDTVCCSEWIQTELDKNNNSRVLLS